MISLDVKGVADLVKALEKVNLNTKAGFEAGLGDAGDYLLEKSQAVVPVDTGALKESGFVESEGSGYGTVVTVGYAEEYAPLVHEFSRNGRKFLEGPARKNKSALRKIVGEAVAPGSTAKGKKLRLGRSLKKAAKSAAKSAKKATKRAAKSLRRAAKKTVKAARKAARQAFKAARRAARGRR